MLAPLFSKSASSRPSRRAGRRGACKAGAKKLGAEFLEQRRMFSGTRVASEPVTFQPISVPYLQKFIATEHFLVDIFIVAPIHVTCTVVFPLGNPKTGMPEWKPSVQIYKDITRHYIETIAPGEPPASVPSSPTPSVPSSHPPVVPGILKGFLVVPELRVPGGPPPLPGA